MGIGLDCRWLSWCWWNAAQVADAPVSPGHQPQVTRALAVRAGVGLQLSKLITQLVNQWLQLLA